MEASSSSQTQIVELQISEWGSENGVPIYQTNHSPIKFWNNPKKISKEAVKGVPGAFLLHNVLSHSECQDFIKITEKMGYGDAPVTTFTGMVMMPDFRNNQRVMWQTSSDVYEPIWSRIKDHIPQTSMLYNKSWTFSSLNERFRFYKYEPGQEFKRHYDGCFPRSKTEMSHLTVIIYLNDECEGGHTIFYTKAGEIKVKPVEGSALIFFHGPCALSPEHEGSDTKNGQKYVLRTDVMYKL